jgi:hypothetical protein
MDATDNRLLAHASLGPGIPDPSPEWITPVAVGRHLPERCRVVVTPILGGLHHEYQLESQAA